MKPSEFDRFAIDLQTKLRKFKREFGMEFKYRVEQKTPVRTGALKRGWHLVVKDTSIELSNTKDYMTYVENGTPKMAPHKMVGTTLLEYDDITKIAKERAGIKE